MRVAGEVVFVGHGIVAPEYEWNDYAGVDMTRQDRADHGERPAGAGRRAAAVRRRCADLLRPLDLQVRGSRAPGRRRRHPDSHAGVGHLSRGRWCRRRGAARSIRCRPSPASPALRDEGMGHRGRRTRDGASAAARISTRCARQRCRAGRRRCRSASQVSGDHRPARAAEDLAERHRRAARAATPPKASSTPRTTTTSASASRAAGRSAGRRPHLQRRARQRVGRRRHARGGAGAGARAGSRPRAVDLRRVHDRRGVGPARRRVLRRAPGAAGRRLGGQHQHRRAEPVRPDEATSCCSAPSARRSAIDGGAARGSSSGMYAAPTRSRGAATSSAPITSRWPRSACRRCRSASSTRVRRQGPRLCAKAQRDGVHREGLPPAERRLQGRTGTIPAPCRTCAYSPSSDGGLRTAAMKPTYHAGEQFARPRLTPGVMTAGAASRSTTFARPPAASARPSAGRRSSTYGPASIARSVRTCSRSARSRCAAPPTCWRSCRRPRGAAASSPTRRATTARPWPAPPRIIGCRAVIVMPETAPRGEGRGGPPLRRRGHLRRHHVGGSPGARRSGGSGARADDGAAVRSSVDHRRRRHDRARDPRAVPAG